MYDLVSIGSISVDLYFKGKTLPYSQDHYYLSSGGKYFVDFFHVGIGGGATNVAIAAKKSGTKVALMAKIGDNSFTHLIEENLKKNNLSTALCRYLKDYYNVSSIFLNGLGEKTVINYRTQRQHYFEHHNARMFQTKSVYIANMSDASIADRLQLIHQYKKRNIFTFMNMGVNDCRRSKDQLEPVVKNVDALIINTHELADLVKVPIRNINFAKVYVPNYWDALENKILIVTDGRYGSYGYHDNVIYYQTAIPPSKIVDTTGAGDGYTGAFIASYLKNKNIKDSMLAGAKYSSKKLEHLGAN